MLETNKHADVAEESLSKDVLYFVPSGPAPLRVLVIETSRLLPALRKKLPNARITAVTEYDVVPEARELAGLDVSWSVLDYRVTPLPFAEGSFDLIVAEPVLSYVLDPYDMLLALGRLLTDVGVLVTSFRNVRYHGVLEELMKGEFPERERHLYAKKEIVRLLNDTLFKEIIFSPGEQDEKGSAERFAAMGFENMDDDLSTAVYLVRACRSTAEVANLKGLYTKKTCTELARVLHRIEYDVEREKNVEALKELCRAEGIFPEYLEDFVRETVLHTEKVMPVVAKIFS